MLHQVGAVSVPFLVAPCDGRAHAGVGLPAFSDHGEGGDFPDGPPLAGPVGHRGVVLPCRRNRPCHHGDRRGRGAVQGRPQGAAGLLYRQSAGADHLPAGHRVGLCRRRCGVPHPQPRDLQMRALHDRRHRRSRGRNPGYQAAWGALASDARDLRHRPDLWPVFGGGSALQRVPVEGDDAGRGHPRHVLRARVAGSGAGDRGRPVLGGLFVPADRTRVPGGQARRLPRQAARSGDRHVGPARIAVRPGDHGGHPRRPVSQAVARHHRGADDVGDLAGGGAGRAAALPAGGMALDGGPCPPRQVDLRRDRGRCRGAVARADPTAP